MQTAFRLDALRGSHPIEVPVKDALDVDQIFDAISYLKGSSVTRMLAAHLGLQAFLEGVSNYLKAHAYGNATTTDLWSALSHASGQDVNALVDPWIRKIGYPARGEMSPNSMKTYKSYKLVIVATSLSSSASAIFKGRN